MKELTFSAEICAPKQKVWETMTGRDTYAAWTGAVWPGSHYVGEWKAGENMSFVGPEGSGTLAAIVEFEPFVHILAKHIAILLPGGVEDRTSDMACGWVGSLERYDFDEHDGITALTVRMTVSPAWVEMFNNDWPRALAALKEVCER